MKFTLKDYQDDAVKDVLVNLKKAQKRWHEDGDKHAFSLTASEGATVELYEGTSGVSGGTAITPRNNNRNSTHVSTVTIVKDPATITSDGTRAAGYIAGGGRVAGVITRSIEKLLKQNTSYLARITSLANSNDISWCAEWYEHANEHSPEA